MTTEELKLSEVTWGDHHVRFLELEGGKYVPVTDIAKATGVRKRSLFRVMDKNAYIFASHERGVPMDTPGGLQRTRCIDSDGAYLLLSQISNHHIKNGDTRAKLAEFNEMIKTRSTGNQLLTSTGLAKDEPDYDSALKAVRFAKELAVVVGTDPLPLICQALDHHDLGIYGGLLVPKVEQKALPAPEKKPKDYLTATDIGERIGKSAHEVYMFLYQQKPPLVVKDQKDEWRLTEVGKEYGEEECREITGGFFVWRIHWRKSILEKMNVQEKTG